MLFRSKISAAADAPSKRSRTGQTPFLWPGHLPVVWARKVGFLRSSVAPTSPRSFWLLYSVLSPVQNTPGGVLEPRCLLPMLRQSTSAPGGPPLLWFGKWPDVWGLCRIHLAGTWTSGHFPNQSKGGPPGAEVLCQIGRASCRERV